MPYLSTRGEAPKLGFSDALLAGLARDGGLYVPQVMPTMEPAAIGALAGLPYAEAATRVVLPFTDGALSEGELAAMAQETYAGFRHPAKAPLVQIDDNLYVLELFHGPTLAFKDFAMQWLGRLMNHVLQKRGARATIVGATSGDTGAAAIEAFGGQSQSDIFILYPHGRVSDVQRRQMTTVDRPNVHAIALEGNFDDCQTILKGLFNDLAFRDAVALSGVNSINWARIVAQIVYYFTSAVSLGAPARRVSFTVPTGNFGDIFAGFCAKKMGLPIERLVIATNENDILARMLASGVYETRGVVATQSPSMDIQISSNFERLLFEAYGRDASALRALMAGFAQSGRFSIAPGPLKAIRDEFDAFTTDEASCVQEMARVYRESGYVLDPHTAVAVHAARRALARDRRVPMIVLSTAHPAKFPDAVERAIKVRPPLPPHLADLMSRQERFTVLPNDRGAVERFIRERAQA
ncbi:threonine synthase [Methylocapsa sp. S129]|uniref:threonine synthase n=1 Tax=Methylocapsa sp. S129 TaxID=1641869 RepID=UPI00131B5D69|nr:threonine synthase [Methylocapsa sp. S129]